MAEGSTFDQIIPKIKEPWFLKFNNSAIMAKNSGEEANLNKMFWNIGMENYKKFIFKCNELDSKSL
jgi:hypothetical protein